MIKAVVNSSPIIALSMINNFDLLWKVFDIIHVPQAVYNEINAVKSINNYGKKELNIAVEQNKISIYKIKDSDLVNKLIGKLHKGELEVIVAGNELDADFAVIDEITARKLAETFSLNTIGVIGILRIAKKQGHISEIKPFLIQLHNMKFRISTRILNRILKEENE